MRNRRSTVRRSWKRFLLKSILLLGIGGILLVAALYGTVRWLTPSASMRQEIAPGVFYQAFEADSSHARGAIMMVEAHWETPGVKIALRPFTERALLQGHHYTLEFADWTVARGSDLVAYLNGTRYTPAERLRSYPGNLVSTYESVTVDGRLSHVSDKSYFLWWDHEGNAVFETTKPPSEKAQEQAVMGIGVQGISVQNGASRHRGTGLDDTSALLPRSFIGIDPERKILWLIAFESATDSFMSEFAARQGVIVGGMLDASNATNMVIGRAAEGVRPFTGIRNPRPLGNYISIHYQEPNGNEKSSE